VNTVERNNLIRIGKICARIAVASLVLAYVVLRLFVLLQTGTTYCPIYVGMVMSLLMVFIASNYGLKVGLTIAFSLILFHFGLMIAADNLLDTPASLRIAYNLVLVINTILPGHISDLNRKLKKVVKEKEQIETVLQQKCQELEFLAKVDPLTELFNRRHFYDLVQKGLEYANQYALDCSIILIDIDRFKQINDTYGHAVGDRVLKEVANCFEYCARPGDIVARFGGEEFIFFVSDASQTLAVDFAEQLRQALEQLKIDHETGKILITASFGVATFKSLNYSEIDITIARADDALYRAKGIGRNMVVIA
jgi:diguanylate cyclase (GGDEF)-like protein